MNIKKLVKASLYLVLDVSEAGLTFQNRVFLYSGLMGSYVSAVIALVSDKDVVEQQTILRQVFESDEFFALIQAHSEKLFDALRDAVRDQRERSLDIVSSKVQASNAEVAACIYSTYGEYAFPERPYVTN